MYSLFVLFFQFETMKKHMKLKAEYENYQFLLSEESLKLIPEYQQMIAVSVGSWGASTVKPMI